MMTRSKQNYYIKQIPCPKKKGVMTKHKNTIDIPCFLIQRLELFRKIKYAFNGHRLNWYSIRFQSPIENIENGVYFENLRIHAHCLHFVFKIRFPKNAKYRPEIVDTLHGPFPKKWRTISRASSKMPLEFVCWLRFRKTALCHI